MNAFIQQGCIKLIKSDSKDVHNVITSMFQRNIVLSNNTEKYKRIHGFYKNIKLHICFQH